MRDIIMLLIGGTVGALVMAVLKMGAPANREERAREDRAQIESLADWHRKRQ